MSSSVGSSTAADLRSAQRARRAEVRSWITGGLTSGYLDQLSHHRPVPARPGPAREAGQRVPFRPFRPAGPGSPREPLSGASCRGRSTGWSRTGVGVDCSLPRPLAEGSTAVGASLTIDAGARSRETSSLAAVAAPGDHRASARDASAAMRQSFEPAGRRVLHAVDTPPSQFTSRAAVSPAQTTRRSLAACTSGTPRRVGSSREPALCRDQLEPPLCCARSGSPVRGYGVERVGHRDDPRSERISSPRRPSGNRFLERSWWWRTIAVIRGSPSSATIFAPSSEWRCMTRTPPGQVACFVSSSRGVCTLPMSWTLRPLVSSPRPRVTAPSRERSAPRAEYPPRVASVSGPLPRASQRVAEGFCDAARAEAALL